MASFGIEALIVCSSVSCRFSGSTEKLSKEVEALWKFEAAAGFRVLRNFSKFKHSTEPSKTDEFELSEQPFT